MRDATTAWPHEQLGDLLRLHRESVNPASRPREVFEHYSIPSFDECGGPVLELGKAIESNKTLLTRPTVLVSKLNPRKPRALLVEGTSEHRRCASTEWMPYVSQDLPVDLRFFKWLLGASQFQRRLARVATGSTNSHVRVSPGETLGWRVASPPLPEQRRIAEVLDTVDEAIRKAEQVIAKLQQLKQGLLHDLLTRGIDENGELRDSERHPEQFQDSPLGRIPKAWGPPHRLDRLERTGIASLGRGNVISAVDIERTPGPYPIYSSSAQREGEFGRYGRFMFDEELITWSVDGGGRPFHRRPHRFSVTNVCGFLRLHNLREWDYRFIHASMALQHGRIKFDWLMKAHPSVIRELYWFARPSLDEQRRIATIQDVHTERVAREASELQKLRTLKHGLMDDLLTGRVRVTVSGEEAS